MRNVSIQVSYDDVEIKSTLSGLIDLYDWLADSPVGVDNDSLALNAAIDLIHRIKFQLDAQKDDPDE